MPAVKLEGLSLSPSDAHILERARSPCRLPDELIDAIIDELGDDLDTLKSCTLACGRFHRQSTTNLFAAHPACISRWGPDRMHTLQASARIREHIASLTLDQLFFEQWRIIRDLPRLRELTISHRDPSRDSTPATPPPPLECTGRALECLTLFRIPPYCADWILRHFVAVRRLRVTTLPAKPAVPLAPARHAVTHLETVHAVADILRYLSGAIDPAALETLSLSVALRVSGGDGRESVLQRFVQAVGTHVRGFRLVCTMSRFYPCELPDLSGLAYVLHVTLHTDTFFSGRHPEQRVLELAFLSALPSGVRRITLLWDGSQYVGGRYVLAEGLQEADWGAVGQALERYADLACVEVGAIVEGTRRAFAPQEGDEAAKAAILAACPARLRAIVKFL